MGIQFAVAITGFTLAGYWLDSKVPSLKPLFTVLGFVVGFAGATASLYYQVFGSKRDQ